MMEMYLKIQAFIFLIMGGEHLYASQPDIMQDNGDDLIYNVVRQSREDTAKLRIITDLPDEDSSSCDVPFHRKHRNLVKCDKKDNSNQPPIVKNAWLNTSVDNTIVTDLPKKRERRGIAELKKDFDWEVEDVNDL